MSPIFQGFYVNIVLCLGLTLLLTTLSSRDMRVRVFLFVLALFFNVRYISWRATDTLPSLQLDLSTIWQWNFFLAEVVAVTLLSWHLLLLVFKPREIVPSDGALTPDQSPSVDVFIPTFNEPRKLLRATIKAAKRIEHDNLQVWVLDDGRRDWLEELCKKEQVQYLRRPDRKGYKAGNLNHALAHSSGDYILCLDADFIANPHILKKTLGYFRDPRIGIVQTPQHFSNPDAIQFNLCGDRAWPDDQCVFTDMLQPCRDNWDNAFCYGTNFIIRRDYLQAVGQFPESSVCEDLLLSYLLKQRGWITRFHNEQLAVGQAAMTLNEFIKQRLRWCRGTLQCLFLRGGPILSRNLSLRDRIFFLDPAVFYLISLWSFIILISPAIYWWTATPPFLSSQGHLLMMLLPRMWVAMLGMYWLTERKVIPVISEIGRHVAIFHTIATIFHTLTSPFKGEFQVTLKDGVRNKTTINWPVLWPHIAVLTITLAGIIFAFSKGDHSRILWDENLGLILALTVYVFWMTFLAMLACIEPALEQKSYRDFAQIRTGSLRQSMLALSRKVIE